MDYSSMTKVERRAAIVDAWRERESHGAQASKLEPVVDAFKRAVEAANEFAGPSPGYWTVRMFESTHNAYRTLHSQFKIAEYAADVASARHDYLEALDWAANEGEDDDVAPAKAKLDSLIAREAELTRVS